MTDSFTRRKRGGTEWTEEEDAQNEHKTSTEHSGHHEKFHQVKQRQGIRGFHALIILVLLHERHVGRHESIEAIFGEREDLIWLPVVEIIKKDASQSSRLASVLDEEILICPLLEFRIELFIVLVTNLLVRAVEVLNVILDQIRWSDVAAAAEPPHATIRLKVTVVEVHGGGVGIAWVHHGAQAARKERHTLSRFIALGAVAATRCGGSQRLLRHAAVNNAERASRLLKNVTLLEHARDSSAAALARPHVLHERGAIQLRNGFANRILSTVQNPVRDERYRSRS